MYPTIANSLIYSNMQNSIAPYKQRVGGSNPSTPTARKPLSVRLSWFLRVYKNHVVRLGVNKLVNELPTQHD